ncbi:hypothetical protein OUZ56_010346 [Daphnia magna]|uniref:Uncharacterized protein n=1 Tax=Daphnia magna TaxID=35525 RepID=A0ABR0AIB2_9CRUS|nr:hypothetical protein OUZ56_010346 [Daphnia magna]
MENVIRGSIDSSRQYLQAREEELNNEIQINNIDILRSRSLIKGKKRYSKETSHGRILNGKLLECPRQKLTRQSGP